jgi:predicted nucleic acid-binding protein
MCTILAPKEKAAICLLDPKDYAYLRLCIAAKVDFLLTDAIGDPLLRTYFVQSPTRCATSSSFDA